MKKVNLQIDISTSQDETLSNLSNSSIFLNKSQVVFKKDGFIVDNKGIKSINTGEPLTRTIEPKLLEVRNIFIKYIYIYMYIYNIGRRFYRFWCIWKCSYGDI